LVRTEAWLVPGEPFPALVYDFGVATWLVSIYSYCLIVAGLFLLARHFIRPHRLYRVQVGTILIGAFIPLLGSVLTLLGLAPSFHRDMVPLASAMGNLVVLWGLLRYGLFDVVPVARDAVFASMGDAVVVLDAQDRVVDLNPVAERFLRQSASQAIGQPGIVVFGAWPHLVEQYRNVQRARAEIALGEGDERLYVGLRLTPVRDRQGQLIGRLVVLRDITTRKRTELALQKAHSELEQRVEERTAELSETNLELRAEVAERKQAENALQRRTDELEALRQMALDVTAQLDLNTLLHSIVARAVELLDSRAGSLSVYRPDSNVLEVMASTGIDAEIVGTTLSPGEGLAGQVWQSGKPVAVDDYRSWEGKAATYDSLDSRAVVGVPIRWGPAGAGGENLGVLDVVSDTPGAYSASDAELLSLFATQAAIAMENARLFQAQHEQHRFAEAMREAAQAMATSLDINEILRLILKQMGGVLAYDSASIIIFREGRAPDLIVGLGYGDDQFTSQESGELLQDSPILTRMAEDLQPVVCDDVRELDDWIWVPGAEHVRSWLSIPLVARDRMIGALMADHSEKAFFGDRDLEIAQSLARQAAQAIENARLYKSEQRQAMEAAAVSAIAQALNATTDLKSVFQAVAHHLGLVVDLDRLSIALLDEGHKQFTVYALAAQDGGPLAPGVTLPLTETSAAEDIVAGRPHLTPDLSTELDRAAESALHESGLRSRLNLPMVLGGRTIGTLNLSSYRHHAFSQDQLPLLTQVADAVAAAVQNARLYEETIRRNRELSLLNRVIAASAASQDIEAILETACQELSQILDLSHAVAGLVSNDRSEATVVAEAETDNLPSLLGLTIPLTKTSAFEILLVLKEPLVVKDVQATSQLDTIRTVAIGLGVASVMLVPLLVEGEVLGGLILGDSEPRSFSDDEVSLVQRMAEQLSGALARARLEEERRGLEHQLQQALRMEALGRLAGGIAHDINNLLTITQLSTQLMQRQLHDKDPLLEHVRQIEETGERATRLIKQLLSFSSRDIIEPRPVTLNDVVGEMSPMLRRVIGEDIQLTVSLADDLWTVRADPSQIEQVIVNLALNARDAMPEGGALTIETANVVIEESFAAAHVDAQPGEHVLLTFGDTGMGMDDEVQAHIFEPFFTTKDAGKGTGLGLATVFGTITQSGGYIHVDSEIGRGTCFKIYLPRVLDAAPPESPRPRPPIVEEVPHGTETILVVEDEAAVRDTAIQVLQSYGYRVLAATNGVEALEVAEQHEGPIHLLLSDVVMPHMSGVELEAKLRSQRPEMQVVFMSGYTPSTIARHGMFDGSVALLPKPFSLEDLVHKVRTALDEGVDPEPGG
jgi:PAS domain S-box-containing protein